MKEIKIEGIDEIIYYTKLENGLDVYLYNKENANNNYVTFTTKFGSIYNEFVPIGKNKMTKVPHGVAHFWNIKFLLSQKILNRKNFLLKAVLYVMLIQLLKIQHICFQDQII